MVDFWLLAQRIETMVRTATMASTWHGTYISERRGIALCELGKTRQTQPGKWSSQRRTLDSRMDNGSFFSDKIGHPLNGNARLLTVR